MPDQTEQPTTWAIRDWDGAFTNRDSRECKTLHWVRWPVKLQSAGFRRLVATAGGREALAVFAGLVEVSANLPRRGVLADESGPLDAVDLSVRTGIPADAITGAIVVLSGPKIRWLIDLDDTGGPPTAKPTNTDGERQKTDGGPRAADQTRPKETRKDQTRDVQGAEGGGGSSVRIALAGGLAGVTGRESPPDARAALARFGVREPNLGILAAVCTAAEVEAEAARVLRDPTVKNLPAVLANRLAAAKGVQLVTSGGGPAQRTAAKLLAATSMMSPKAIEEAERIERIRARQRRVG